MTSTMHGSPPNNKRFQSNYNSCTSTSLEAELQVDLYVAVVAVDQTLPSG